MSKNKPIPEYLVKRDITFLSAVGMMGFSQQNVPAHLKSPTSVDTQTIQWLVADEKDLILALSRDALEGNNIGVNYHQRLYAGNVLSATPATGDYAGHLIIIQSVTGVQYSN